MSVAKANTACIIGIDGYVIRVEADVSIGLGAFNIVGLPDGMIKESKDRIMSALNNSLNGFPIRKVIVNLAPADIKKIGTGFDLPIALAILAAHGDIPADSLESYLIIGELSLDGRIRPIDGILATVLAAKKAGFKSVIVPEANSASAAMIEDISIFSAREITEVVNFFKNMGSLAKIQVEADKVLISETANQLDFSDVKGQATAKRVLEIAAAGKHNVLFSGSPGSGKSMLAKRMPSILPDFSFEEALETTKIHSIAGKLGKKTQLMYVRPFRSPHHSISSAGLVGGGTYPKPGEVSLAHNGVLFLDELPEFGRHTLDLLRQPLEDKSLTISRSNMSLRFPSDFILLAAMNPCPCGYLGDSQRDCNCSATGILKYRSRISGPLFDRIDLQVEMPTVSYEELHFSEKGESSSQIRLRVAQARNRQLERLINSDTNCNANMSHQEVEKYCQLDSDCHNLLQNALQRLRLSARGHDNILKVARTIADLDASEPIKNWHLGEAINYRSLDREINF